MDWFMHHAVLLGLVTVWLLEAAGGQRADARDLARRPGRRAAYLRRQYTTIAIVAIVPFLLLGFYDKLGWGTAIGFLIGAVLSAPPASSA
jgi:K(+)-stimulated pyrophosphate-energized sodium pump